jgi:hypothetical protein
MTSYPLRPSKSGRRILAAMAAFRITEPRHSGRSLAQIIDACDDLTKSFVRSTLESFETAGYVRSHVESEAGIGWREYELTFKGLAVALGVLG